MGDWKDVENRKQRTHYRGTLAIHVATRVARNYTELLPPPDVFPWAAALLATSPLHGKFGHVIGTVELVDCVRDYDSPWALPDHWHWVLENPRMIEPVPAKGRLGLWEWGA